MLTVTAVIPNTGGTSIGATATRSMTQPILVQYSTSDIEVDDTTLLVPPMRSATRPMGDAGWAMNSSPHAGARGGRVFAYVRPDPVDINRGLDQVPRV
jgi:hypothetical protein